MNHLGMKTILRTAISFDDSDAWDSKLGDYHRWCSHVHELDLLNSQQLKADNRERLVTGTEPGEDQVPTARFISYLHLVTFQTLCVNLNMHSSITDILFFLLAWIQKKVLEPL